MNLTESEIERVKDLVDDPFEDYAFVLSDLHDQGVESVICYVWCEECEEECEAEVDTESFEWTCPNCGHVSDQ